MFSWQAVLSVFEESKGELRCVVYLPALSVTVDMLVNQNALSTCAANLDRGQTSRYMLTHMYCIIFSELLCGYIHVLHFVCLCHCRRIPGYHCDLASPLMLLVCTELEAGVESEDVSVRMVPIADRLEVSPSWTAVANMGYATYLLCICIYIYVCM